MQTNSPVINEVKNLKTRATNLTPFYVINSIISIAIMVGFKYVVTPVEPLTPMGIEILGIFIGVIYGWLIVGDIYWPSLLGLVFLGLSDWTTVPNAFKTGFGHNNVMLMLFFFLFANILNAAGITEYIARWITSRKIAEGKPYVITLLIWIASMVLYFMVTATAAAIIMFPLVIEISKIYGLKPGNKWTCMVLIGLIVTSGTSYILLPYKSLPLVVFSSYEALGGEPINMAKYMLLVIIVTVLMTAMVFITVKYFVKPDVSAIASKKVNFKELPKLTSYQKSVLVFFVVTITLVIIPNFLPQSYWISKTLKEVGTPGIMSLAVMLWYGLRWKGAKVLWSCSLTALVGVLSLS
ncbi:MAG: SLC13 family permease [Peptococcales bacterium]